MKEKLIEVLTKQKDIGSAFTSRLKTISNITELDKLIFEYDAWDKTNCNILNESFVQKQLFNMYSGAPYLGNVNIDSNSFQGKRDRIIYCLPKKMMHLNTAIAHSQSSRAIDLLPLDEETINSASNQLSKNLDMKKLFVSHSSLDDPKIKPLIDLINLIGVPHDKIFYCSIPGYGLKPGENIFDGLKRELSNEVFALFMLSRNFYESPVCLCEMGAVWIKSYKQIPILIPPMEFNEMGGVFPNTIGFKINDKSNMNSLKDELEKFFGLPQMDFSRWEEKRDEFIIKINTLL